MVHPSRLWLDGSSPSRRSAPAAIAEPLKDGSKRNKQRRSRIGIGIGMDRAWAALVSGPTSEVLVTETPRSFGRRIQFASGSRVRGRMRWHHRSCRIQLTAAADRRQSPTG